MLVCNRTTVLLEHGEVAIIMLVLFVRSQKLYIKITEDDFGLENTK